MSISEQEKIWRMYSRSAYEDDCAPYNVIYEGDFNKLYDQEIQRLKEELDHEKSAKRDMFEDNNFKREVITELYVKLEKRDKLLEQADPIMHLHLYDCRSGGDLEEEKEILKWLKDYEELK